MLKRKPIYVEALIRTDMQSLWTHTQTPELHEQWDLRFSEIRYMPKEDPEAAQHFRYRTRIGFGVSIDGDGETKGMIEQHGVRTSTLVFRSDSPISLIREGAGFWRYSPGAEGIRFITRYDYRTRWGALGAAADRFLFRPLIGWATAWSFDCLRLWLEKGIPPRQSVYRALTDLICFAGLMAIWIYQGLVPKLLVQHQGELRMLQAAGAFGGYESLALKLAGAAEIGFGLLFAALGRTRRKAMYIANGVFLLVLLAGAAFTPSALIAPFNPISLTIAMEALTFAGLASLQDSPDASRCLRQPIES